MTLYNIPPLPPTLDRRLNIMIGADPELFAFSKKNGLPVSVHDILPGTKDNPSPVPRGSIQVDGVAAEFNITPSQTVQQFLKSISTVRAILDVTLKSKNSDLEFRLRPIAEFPIDYFTSLPPAVKALGCQPDFNAYTGKANAKPDNGKPFRTASGHIHIGWVDMKGKDPHLMNPFEEEHFSLCRKIVKELDFVLYNSSLQWDVDQKRRQLYGQPGAFRPKPYGLEYRVLSNMWLHDVGTQRYVFDASKAVTAQVIKGIKISEGYFAKDPLKVGDFENFCAFLENRHIPSLWENKYSPTYNEDK